MSEHILPHFENGWSALPRQNAEGTWDVEWGRLYCKTPVWKEKHESNGLTLDEVERLFEEIAAQPVWVRHTRWSDPESHLYYPGLSKPLPPLDHSMFRASAGRWYYPLPGTDPCPECGRDRNTDDEPPCPECIEGGVTGRGD